MSTMSGIWDCVDEHSEDGVHAALRYDEIASSGPAARPLDFPAPTVFRCEKVVIQAKDHRSGTIHSLRNVIIRSEPDKFGQPADTAYLVKKKIAKSTYGSVRLCIVLKRCIRTDEECTEDRQDCTLDDLSDLSTDRVEWESTDMQAVIKASEWSKIHALRGRHLEDPIKEISAMQLLGNYHRNVLGAVEVLQDDDYLYTVMPHVSGGDLYGRLLDCFPRKHESENPEDKSYGFDESQARVWFRQLLLALFHFQKKGVCHGDISLENILLDDKDQVVLIDPGMSLRVPYTDPCNYGCVADVSAGTCRRLMKAQGQGGKLMYAAPEVIGKKEAVDAFAIDLWSAGVVLFVMLVGLAPFKWAHPTDKRYSKISKGGLKDLMDTLDIPLSPEASDLLQGFFWADPRRRLTLAEVMEHPWVQGKRFVDISLRPSNSPKKFTFNHLDNNKAKTTGPKSCENLKRTRFRSCGPRLVTPHL